ncbi:MAG TPA: N-acetylmuramoyl-L-alanine amidase, partial [Patescibacteria group bacterium]|nr:N-acetylmuramoyl-L-alanine amidase [Patescibacteria group bacterium]
KECNLKFATEDFSDWKTNQQYYTLVDISKFNPNSPDGFGQEILNISEGNVNLKYNYLTQQVQQTKAERNVDRIVIHYTEGPTAQSAIDTIVGSGESIQYMIDKDGTVLSSENSNSPAFVPESQVAHHAGCVTTGKNARPACHQPNPNNDEKANGTKYPLTDTNCCIPGINQRSIGIEIVNLGNQCGITNGQLCNLGQGQTCKQICQDAGNSVVIDGQVWEKFTDAQIDSLVLLVSDIASRYDIPLDREHIIGHDEIDPGERSDPGPAFPWDDFIARLKAQPQTIPSDVGENIYAVDKNNSQYAIKILSIVGKTEKNA